LHNLQIWNGNLITCFHQVRIPTEGRVGAYPVLICHPTLPACTLRRILSSTGPGSCGDRQLLKDYATCGLEPSRSPTIMGIDKMNDAERAEAIRGKIVRMTWTDGPTKGKTYDHDFRQDGTVEWRDAAGPSSAAAQGQPPKEQAKYAAVRVADDIYAVSYLAPSGFTLTVVLNLRDKRMVGFASGAKEWYPVRGTFEIVK
jgi:hypothetical protein